MIWKCETEPKLNIHKNALGVEWLTYPALDACPEIVHGFSTRKGGISTGYLEEMNLSFSRGDDPENV